MTVQKYQNLMPPGKVTTSFGGQTRGENFHPGVDFANKSGTPIPAFADGKVTHVGRDKNGFGNILVLKDKGGNVHQYGHLLGALVKPGKNVKRGQIIAKMGRSGNVYSPSNGDPSHLDIRIASAFGKWKNPMSFFNNLQSK